MDSIISDQTGRYRRNMIVAAFVLLLIAVVPGVNFSDAGIFGVKVASTGRKSEIAVLSVLLLILVYQWALFTFYAYIEFRTATRQWEEHLSVLSVLFNMGISARELKGKGFDSWEIEPIGEGDSKSHLVLKLYGPNHPTGYSRALPEVQVLNIRRSLFVFVLIDLAIPFLVAEWAVILTVRRLLQLLA